MSDLKTKPTEQDVESFLNEIDDDQKKADCFELLDLLSEITGEPPKMWGKSMVGFGSYHYKYDSGREGDWFLTGFSPQKQNLTIYIMAGFEKYEDTMSRLGKYKIGKSCLYVKRLSDIEKDQLKVLIKKSETDLKKRYP